MNNEPLVSIITPAYNAEKYIAKTLDSALNQTYKNIEIIVVNDCSTDRTLEIINEYAKNDSRVKAYSNEKNLRVAKTRNFAISKATGKYIAFLDADDIWDLNKLEKQIAFMEKEGHKLTYTAIRFINDEGEYTNKTFNIPTKVNFNKLLKQNVITLSSAVVLRDLLPKVPFHNDELHEDFILWLEILKKDLNYAYGINEFLVDYRLTVGSKSRNKFKSMKMTYKTYRLMGVNFIKAHWNLMFYIIKSLKKYKGPKK